MAQVGVPVKAIRNKMIQEGLHPDLEKPDAPGPEGEGEKMQKKDQIVNVLLVAKLNFNKSDICICRYIFTFYQKKSLNFISQS